MLQVARLAPQLLGDSAESVASFLASERLPSGAFRGRDGEADLYYTVFGLDALTALDIEAEADQNSTTRDFLRSYDGGEGFDLVHLACLARGWAAVGIPDEDRAAHIEPLVDRLLDLRREDGGWAMTSADLASTSYSTFLAIGALQDLDIPIARPSDVVAFLEALALDNGGYALDAETRIATTPTTAASVVALRQLGARSHGQTGRWLRSRIHRQGGFLAADEAPMPDLLSTATALHALVSLQTDLAPIREACLDFIDTLWTARGGFYGSWEDDALDCEYTYYGLLALGHLSLP